MSSNKQCTRLPLCVLKKKKKTLLGVFVKCPRLSLSLNWHFYLTLPRLLTALLHLLSPGSIVYLGMMFGAFFWGGLSDKVGRKQCLLISMSVNGFFAFLSSFVQGYSMFLFCRMVSGFGWVQLAPLSPSLSPCLPLSLHFPINVVGKSSAPLRSFSVFPLVPPAALCS